MTTMDTTPKKSIPTKHPPVRSRLVSDGIQPARSRGSLPTPLKKNILSPHSNMILSQHTTASISSNGTSSIPIVQAPIKQRKYFFSLLLIVAIMSVIFIVLYFYAVSNSEQKKSSPQHVDNTVLPTANQARIDQAIAELHSIVVIPDDVPTVAAIVSDAPLLAQQQVFYKNAQNGDVLLVYQSTLQAYLYSVSRHMLVNSGPIQQQNNATSTPIHTQSTRQATSTPVSVVPHSKQTGVASSSINR